MPQAPRTTLGSKAARCPICKTDLTHLDRVEGLAATGNGLALTAHGEDANAFIDCRSTRRAVTSRRHEFHLRWSCENGHDWTEVFAQDKGETIVTLSVRGVR